MLAVAKCPQMEETLVVAMLSADAVLKLMAENSFCRAKEVWGMQLGAAGMLLLFGSSHLSSGAAGSWPDGRV